MKLLKSMMVSCREATFLISKREERKLSFGERIHLAMHLSMCEFCKAFEKQSAFIGKQAKNFISVENLTPEDKARILKSLAQ
ncbi:MAG TPA: zf-HC2 domain-containing protein [Bacteroidia bacterium]